MLIGIPKESAPGQTLVAATGATTAKLVRLGYDVVVESGAGGYADQADAAYLEAGGRVGTAEEVWAADVVVKIDAPTEDEIARLREGATVVAMMAPARSPELVESLGARGVTALALDAVPRISRAQSMDVLSSMANVGGYRAVVEAAHEFGRMFTGQVTAAGKVPPARVFVVGAGVAGLAAIGAAGSMGAIVRAFDVRPEVAEQVASMGGDFVTVEMETEVSSDGYAKEMTAEQELATAVMYAEEATAADIVITTALIPGRPAPTLITAETVAAMRPGSVIVDMAAATGGNCELTVPGQRTVTENGVIILGYTDLPGRLAAQTSQLYGTNVVNLMTLLTPGKDGQLTLDLEDVVQRGLTVTRSGEVLWPPPPVQVSAAPAPTAPAAVAAPAEKRPALTESGKVTVVSVAAAALFALIALSPPQLQGNLTVFALAVVIGFYVIGHVHHALHTPLMSVTNAISGIIVVGAILQIGDPNRLISALAFVAVLVASINIFGGFAVTRRMLGMFSRS
ncbi:Re/Si-specific NAD(P)(+) transhydrogenase subunit alpha [Nocardioides insulae]|uniref:Re/Si-specific NAD(P)(+) transhydrogenase subunit alpha n=1 Tax=Nocardioides insulae TaxID=394734 RepID=UPI000407BE54|nr:Re/Si-specific NAD(P)(+) transhydrogenase subunit alpha [Nocardioides insulae]